MCARICARDTAGQAGTKETQKTDSRFSTSVCRAQHAEQRLPETGETHVVSLITQRSRVQIPSPLPSLQVRGLFRSWKGPLCICPVREIAHEVPERAAAAAGR